MRKRVRRGVQRPESVMAWRPGMPYPSAEDLWAYDDWVIETTHWYPPYGETYDALYSIRGERALEDITAHERAMYIRWHQGLRRFRFPADYVPSQREGA